MKNPVLIVLVLLSFTLTAFAQSPSPVITDYLQLKDALVASDASKAGQAAASLASSIKSAGDFKQKPALTKQINTLVDLKDLEKQRAAFAPLSELIYEYAKTLDNSDQTLYYQYCPMKKSYWVSAEPGIRNPYYGSKMLACGSVKETLPDNK